MPAHAHNPMKPAMKRNPPLLIDAHHHLWKYVAEDYRWITEEMGIIRRDFILNDLKAELAATGIEGTVAVQAQQTIAETLWLLSRAEENESPILGVVGWAPIAEETFERHLEALRSHSKLVGLRHIVQEEPPGFLERAEFNRGISLLRDTGLVYDILIYPEQMDSALRFIDRHPDQQFVLDHCAKPRIADGEIEPWRTHLLSMAERPNVCCKLSGLITEADWKSWSPSQIEIYLDIALAAFGAERLMAGSDWPVCQLAASYGQWWQVLRSHSLKLSENEQAAIFGCTAERIYRLTKSPA